MSIKTGVAVGLKISYGSPVKTDTKAQSGASALH